MRVLVVEDHATLAGRIAQGLRQAGMAVDAVHDGAAALDAAAQTAYDVIVLDCAPTAESMRFVSMPTTLEWYMKHVFPFQRGLLKAAFGVE